MIYQATRLNPPEQIAKGNYKGFDYYVLNLGTHPCAYIDVTDTELKYTKYSNIDIGCHGGLTYSREYLNTVDKKGWFIGWDYAHYCDFAGYELAMPTSLSSYGKKWTTQKIVNECKSVIEQLVKLLKPSLKPEYRDGDPDAPICPNCRTPLNEMEDCDCGQKIDWSEE